MNRERNNQWVNPQMPNGANGSQGTNGARQNGGAALTGSLAEQILALQFVKAELELYLDTHPSCQTALDYYQRTLEELERLTERYENEVGPLTAAGVRSTDDWSWIRGPWPWQNERMRGGK